MFLGIDLKYLECKKQSFDNTCRFSHVKTTSKSLLKVAEMEAKVRFEYNHQCKVHYQLCINWTANLVQVYIQLANMQKEFVHIPALLALLKTDRVRPAEGKLVYICQSEKAMDHLRSLLAGSSIDQSIKQLAASLVSRMLIDHASSFSEGYGQKYLLGMVADLTLPYAVKKMVANCLCHHSKQSSSFLERLLGITEDMLVSVQSVIIKESPKTLQFLNEPQLDGLAQDFTHLLDFKLANEKDWINACETIIVIGEAILSLIIENQDEDDETSEEQQEVELAKVEPVDFTGPVLRFISYCGFLHKTIFNESNIHQFPQIFEKLFILYQQLTEENANISIAHQCLVTMAGWEHLSLSIKTAYRFDMPKQEITYLRLYTFEQSILTLRFEASMFHTKLIKYLLDAQLCQQVHQMLSPFIESIRATVTTYDTVMPQKIHQNFVSLLYYYHVSRDDNNIAEMMADFEGIIVPLITKILAADRFSHFMQAPWQMYKKLSAIVQNKFDSDDILVALSNTVKHFISISSDFFLYLFQTFRFSLQRRLKCESGEDWEPPEYLLKSKPLELITIFYLMSIIPYENEISPFIFSYLKMLITPNFVEQLDYMQIALFYFFLEQGYLQLYEENLQQGNFLLMHIFKEQTNPSSKYFLYEFIYRLSEYYIDSKYILIYAQHLPRLYDYQNKWDNMINWIANLQDFGEEFAFQLVGIIKDHIRNEIMLSAQNKQEVTAHYRQLKNYYEVLAQIAKNKKFLRKKPKFQFLLLQQYSNAQNIFDLDIEDRLHALLAQLLPFFKAHEQFYNSILEVLIKKHSRNRIRQSTNFYFLLAEYIYHTRDTGVLMYIYEYIDETVDYLQLAPQIKEGERAGLLINIANILILFQNLLMVHVKAMGGNLIRRIAAKVLAIEKFVTSQVSGINQKPQLWTIYARCISIELAIFSLLKYQKLNLIKYYMMLKRAVHKEYDSQFLVEILDMLNRISPIKNRSCILYIMLDIIKFLREEKQENVGYDSEEERAYRNLFQLPNKMTPVIIKCRSISQQIKKFMSFYRIPNWNNIDTRSQMITFDFISELKRQYEACMKFDTLPAAIKSEYILTIDEGKEAYIKRRRRIARDEDEDDEDPVRRTMHETFSKRVKRDVEMLPKDVQEPVMASEDSSEEQIDEKENDVDVQVEGIEGGDDNEAVELLVKQTHCPLPEQSITHHFSQFAYQGENKSHEQQGRFNSFDRQQQEGALLN